MKQFLAVCVLVCFLTGCGNGNAEVSKIINLRNRIMQGKECRFMAEVTADYGDSTYTFSMECNRDKTGNMTIIVTAPETISGITARISEGTGQLTFEDEALMFALVADGQITPICGPWIFMKALSAGYINTAGKAEHGIRAQIDDSFSGIQFSMDIWTDADNIPSRAELIWDGRRILSIDIDDFVIM